MTWIMFQNIGTLLDSIFGRRQRVQVSSPLVPRSVPFQREPPLLRHSVTPAARTWPKPRISCASSNLSGIPLPTPLTLTSLMADFYACSIVVPLLVLFMVSIIKLDVMLPHSSLAQTELWHITTNGSMFSVPSILSTLERMLEKLLLLVVMLLTPTITETLGKKIQRHKTSAQSHISYLFVCVEHQVLDNFSRCWATIRCYLRMEATTIHWNQQSIIGLLQPIRSRIQGWKVQVGFFYVQEDYNYC